MTDDSPEVTPRDALEIAQRALAKANRVDELEEQIDDLQTELAKVQLRLSEQEDDRSYESYTLDEKIGMVREHAFEKAVSGHGRAKLDYSDVMWEVFDGDPGPSHCYKLLQRAGDAKGFEYREPDGGTKHLAINAETAKRGAAFYPENKAGEEEGAL